MRGPVAFLLLTFLPILVSADNALPIPPQQKQPWTPPATNLPPQVVDAITELFKQGLSDPRGCEYREIEIPWGEGSTKTHGWTLPGGKEAVGWDGFVYSLKSAGNPVELEKDVNSLLVNEGFQANSSSGSWNLSEKSPIAIKVALLLRLGRADLAERVWKWGSAGKVDQSVTNAYLLMASPWLIAQYECAVEAHVNGNDAQALALCRTLVPLVTQAEASAARRGIPRPEKSPVYFERLAQLLELAADQERRAKEAPYQTVLDSGLPAQGPERISALIRDLEQVHVMQEMNPGQTNTYDDPTVQALITEGAAAIGPLIDCWENDPRLARTNFSEGMRMWNGPLVHVYEPAYIALSVILDHPFYFSDEDNVPLASFHNRSDPRDGSDLNRKLTPEDRKLLGEKMRAYVEKRKGMTLAQQWFADLQDDQAGPARWIRAINRITMPADQVEVSFGIFGGTMGWGFPQPSKGPLKGDELRAKTNPSVSDLIIKRTNQIIPMVGTNADVEGSDVGNLILALSYWNGKAQLDEVKNLTHQYQQQYRAGRSGFSPINDQWNSILQYRLGLGDSTALQEYADGMQTLSPHELASLQFASPFQIMWHYPDDPRMQALAEKLFNPKDTSFVSLPAILIRTPLIGMAAFRKALLRGLDETSPGGKVEVQPFGFQYDFKAMGGSSSTSSDPPQFPPDAPKPGTIVPFRVCDAYAYQLSQVNDFPAFKLYWPIEKRNAAIATCKDLLRQYGDAFQKKADDPYDNSGPPPEAWQTGLRLSPLDHSATPDDVKAGRAIFSLPGKVRVWKMPAYPMGPAWQAEEVLLDGKWQRYFGIIENGEPKKVPAEKMDFGGPNPPPKVTPQIAAIVDGPTMPRPAIFQLSYAEQQFLPLNMPLPLTISLINERGMEVPTPGALVIPAVSAKALPAGITLSAEWSDKLPPAIQRFGAPIFDPAPFHDLPLKPGVSVVPAQPDGPLLIPTVQTPILQIDLRDYFDMSRPGIYRVKVQLHVPGQPVSELRVNEFKLK